MNTQKRSSKTKTSTGRKLQPEAKTIGIDIGDQWSHYCVLDEEGEVLEEGRLRTNAEGFAQHFASEAPVRIAIENGTHSIWINEQLLGYDVIVANVRELHCIAPDVLDRGLGVS